MAKTETIDQLTERLATVKNQRALTKELNAATAAKLDRPMIAAIESRISALAKEVKASQRGRTQPMAKDAATGKRAGKPAPQNSVPIAPGTFGKPDATPLSAQLRDKPLSDPKVAFGDDKSLIRNVEPVALAAGVTASGNDMVSAGDIELDTTGLPARVEATHVYLMDGDKPVGRCELAAPLPLAPGERALFRAGTLLFKA